MENWKDRLAALVPCYDWEGGNATLVYTTGGEVAGDRRTLRWNLRRLARIYCVDLEAARQNYGGYLNCRQGVPLPFSASLVLVPLKTREAVGKNDGCYGYFNPAAVRQCIEEPAGKARAALILPGDFRVSCYYSLRTVQKRLRAGEIILERYRGEIMRGEVSANSSSAPLSPQLSRLLERLLQAVFSGERNEDQ